MSSQLAPIELGALSTGTDPQACIHGHPVSPPFEGAEKLLEIAFVTPELGLPVHGAHPEFSGLRSIPEERWNQVLKVVRCKALITVKLKHWHSLVLSESSLFIDTNRIILKTCGRTNLLSGIDLITEMAESIGFRDVSYIYYTRKAFLFPENQPMPHQSWDNEVKFLRHRFPQGSEHTFGEEGEDNWHVFAYEPKEGGQRDCTLEILMTGMSPEASQKFYTLAPDVADPLDQEEYLPARELSEQLGLDAASLLGSGHTDAVAFLPCGFSANLIGGEDERRYGTIHVTPELTHSYASFECNLDFANRQEELERLISQISRTFSPKKLLITMFESHALLANGESKPHTANQALEMIVENHLIPGYKLTTRHVHNLRRYSLQFAILKHPGPEEC